MDTYKLKIVLLFTVGFIFASLLGYITQRIKLSPTLGYLLGGYLIGPYSPGFVVDLEVSEQLAEIGVIMMMFGVGLHFKWEELANVRRIAIPGAIGQTFVTALAATLLMHTIGWSIEAGIIIGVAIGVASTVVLVRVLADNNLLGSPQGHIAVGWLIVEDLLTVAVLIMLPIMDEALKGSGLSPQQLTVSMLTIVVKFALLALIVFTVGRKSVTFVLSHVARTRSHELFTLTVLAITFAVAIGSALIFGTSIALGAFIAGMVIGGTEMRHQALANSLPLKDVFVVLFFLSIGMLFNPQVIIDHFAIFVAILAIILLLKPLIAFLIVLLKKYPFKTAITVGIALGQIGEFSFILAEESSRIKILPDEGYDIIVACALISIAINPLFFKAIDFLTFFFEGVAYDRPVHLSAGAHLENRQKAVVVGYGPIGKGAVRTLEKLGYSTIIVERNVDTVDMLNTDYVQAVYGDASQEEILLAAQIKSAVLLVITLPETEVAEGIIRTARSLRPDILVLARAGFKSEEQLLKNLSVNFISSEEETVKAFSQALYRLTDSYSRGYHHTQIGM